MILLVVIGNLLLLALCESQSSPVITTPQGILTGLYLKTVNDRTFSSFTGIPYAEPPVGNLRFQAPKAAKPWSGILNATLLHPACPQKSFSGIIGQEDCLYLNIYTPKLTFSSLEKLLPVIFYIYGGAFMQGEANRHIYNPNIIMDQDVIFVTVNYRIGPLGFLSTGDEIVPGNNGLKDQVLALNWVKQNVIFFGGNPNNIIVMGQSSGAVSAHMFMMSPLSRDLIKGVVSLSGTGAARWALSTKNETLKNTKRLASLLKCPTFSSAEMVNCLRKIDVENLILGQFLFYEWNLDPMIPFKPTIEPNITGAFLVEHPAETIKSNNAAKVPFVVGFTTQDGTLRAPAMFRTPQALKEFNTEYMKVAPITFLYRETAPDIDYVSVKIREYYFQNRTIDTSSISKTNVTDAYTDCYFMAPSNDAVWLHINYTSEPVYYFLFGYRGSVSFGSLSDDPHNYGVAHTDDLLYLFNFTTLFPTYIPNATDKNLQSTMTSLWANFAKTGYPTPMTDSVIFEKWEPVESENLEYYSIKSDTLIDMRNKLRWERTKFWKNLPLN